MLLKSTLMRSKMEKLKTSFIWTFIFGIAAHGYCFFNPMFGHDGALIYLDDDFWKASIGRWFVGIYRNIRSRYSAPWLTGILCLVYLSLAVFLITEIFDICDKWIIALISGAFSTSIIFASLNASYIHDSDSYMFVVLVAVFTAWVLTKNKISNTILKVLVAGALISIMLGIYQAYIPMTVAIVAMVMQIMCFDKAPIKDVIKLIIETLVAHVVGAVLYVIEVALSIRYYQVPLAQGSSNSLSLDNLNILGGTHTAYVLFAEHFFKADAFTPILVVVANLLIIVLAVLSLAVILKNQKLSAIQLFLAIAAAVLMPLILNALCLIADVRFVMQYQYCLVYVFVLEIVAYALKHHSSSIKASIKKSIPIILAVAISVGIFSNITITNAIYTKKEMDYQATWNLMGDVVYDIEKLPGYKMGETEVVFIGSPSKWEGQHDRFGFSSFDAETIKTNYSVTGYYTYVAMINQIMNKNMVIGDSIKAREMAEKPEIADMPYYPYAGSVQMIGDVAVVKFSDYALDI